MAMPAWLTLTRLPWGAILKESAFLLTAANELRTRSRRITTETGVATTLEAVRRRLDELEQRERATAELLTQLVEQAASVAAAAEATAVKARQAYVLAVFSAVTAAGAALLALIAVSIRF